EDVDVGGRPILGVQKNSEPGKDRARDAAAIQGLNEAKQWASALLWEDSLIAQRGDLVEIAVHRRERLLERDVVADLDVRHGSIELHRLIVVVFDGDPLRGRPVRVRVDPSLPEPGIDREEHSFDKRERLPDQDRVARAAAGEKDDDPGPPTFGLFIRLKDIPLREAVKAVAVASDRKVIAAFAELVHGY